MTGMRFYRVLYLKAGIEHKSAWFISIDRARQALDIVRGKGYRAIILALSALGVGMSSEPSKYQHSRLDARS